MVKGGAPSSTTLPTERIPPSRNSSACFYHLLVVIHFWSSFISCYCILTWPIIVICMKDSFTLSLVCRAEWEEKRVNESEKQREERKGKRIRFNLTNHLL